MSCCGVKNKSQMESDKHEAQGQNQTSNEIVGEQPHTVQSLEDASLKNCNNSANFNLNQEPKPSTTYSFSATTNSERTQTNESRAQTSQSWSKKPSSSNQHLMSTSSTNSLAANQPAIPINSSKTLLNDHTPSTSNRSFAPQIRIDYTHNLRQTPFTNKPLASSTNNDYFESSESGSKLVLKSREAEDNSPLPKPTKDNNQFTIQTKDNRIFTTQTSFAEKTKDNVLECDECQTSPIKKHLASLTNNDLTEPSNLSLAPVADGKLQSENISTAEPSIKHYETGLNSRKDSPDHLTKILDPGAARTAIDSETPKSIADLSRVNSIGGIPSEEDIDKLSISQMKAVLTNEKVNFKDLTDRKEFVAKLKALWQTYQKESKSEDSDGKVSDGSTCKICLSQTVNCVFLECGHMMSCIDCASKIKECPICKYYITRVVRVFPN